MYTYETLTQKVSDILKSCLNRANGKILPEMNLLDDLMIDSVELVDILLYIEYDIGVEITNLDKVNTVADLYQMVWTLSQKTA